MKLTNEDIQKRLDKEFSGYTLLSNYKTMRDKITLRHECGYKFKISGAAFFLSNNNEVCPICKKKRRIKYEK